MSCIDHVESARGLGLRLTIVLPKSSWDRSHPLEQEKRDYLETVAKDPASGLRIETYRDGADLRNVFDSLHRNDRLDGILTPDDEHLEFVAEACEHYKLNGNPRHAARSCSDKLEQRRALRQAGVPTPKFRSLDNDSTELASFPLPAVIKPRRGVGSAGTKLVSTAEEISVELDRLRLRRRSGWMIEEFLPGQPDDTHDWCADQHSVELVLDKGHALVAVLVGSFPKLPGFRSQGSFCPLDLPDGIEADARQLATRAAVSLGLHTGPVHVEIKFTPSGPRIIEVNGRIGGCRHFHLQHAMGVDLVGITLALAASGAPPSTAPAPTGDVTSVVYVNPARDGLVTQAAMDTQAVERMPGLLGLFRGKVVGDTIRIERGASEVLYKALFVHTRLEQAVDTFRALRMDHADQLTSSVAGSRQGIEGA